MTDEHTPDAPTATPAGPVHDPRLGRIASFDPASRRFGVRQVLPSGPPRSYTWACNTWLDQGMEGACFPAGTLVQLADGSHRPIETVGLLDEVVTAEGRTGRVVQTMVRRAAELVRVRLVGHNRLICTPEHPILTQRGYVAAAELQRDDRVALTRYLPPGESVIDAEALAPTQGLRGVIEGRVNTGGVITDVAAVPEMLARTPALGRLLGLYAAEGCTTENKVVWSYATAETDTLVAETVDLVKTCFGAVARLQVRPNNSTCVVLYGKRWRMLFEALVPGTARYGDKRLSGHVTDGPPDYLRALLTGWQDGDGHRRRSTVDGISTSKTLALNMHAIAQGLGLRPALTHGRPTMNKAARTRQDRWTVSIGSGSGVNQQPQDAATTWRRVRGVERVAVDRPEWVYNLHVEGDESYVADGIGVHNCTGYSRAHEIAARPRPRPMTDDDAKLLYYRARQLDDWPGENYEGSSVLAAAKAAAERGWIKTYRWAFGLDDLVGAVGYVGPAVLGINWYEQMSQTDRTGQVRVDGQMMGGHAILCNGVDVRKRLFRLHNSWGTGWGIAGDCFVSYADMERLLHEDGEASISTKN